LAYSWNIVLKIEAFCFLLFAFNLFLLPLQSFWAEYTGAAQEIGQNLLKLIKRAELKDKRV
jgi:hypothetical protein